MSHPELDRLGKPEWYEAYDMQIYLARDGWDRVFIEVGPDGVSSGYMNRIIAGSGRKITFHRVDEESSSGSAASSGEVNFVFFNLGPEKLRDAVDRWWPKIRVGGWIGGHGIFISEIKAIVADMFRVQYDTHGDGDMLRVLGIGRAWLVPKFQDQRTWPFNPNYFTRRG